MALKLLPFCPKVMAGGGPSARVWVLRKLSKTLGNAVVRFGCINKGVTVDVVEYECPVPVSMVEDYLITFEESYCMGSMYLSFEEGDYEAGGRHGNLMSRTSLTCYPGGELRGCVDWMWEKLN